MSEIYHANDAAIDGELSFRLECDKMKSILRRTMLADYSRRENDAEHSWHLALTILTLAPHMKQKFDMGHALSMACVHDLVEIYAGDTFAYDEKGYEDKLEREEAAARKLFAMLPEAQGEEFYRLWKEFDEMETTESRLANAADRIQPFLNNLATYGHTWRLGDVKKSQVLKRMAPVWEALPDLKDFMFGAIDDAVSRGWLAEG